METAIHPYSLVKDIKKTLPLMVRVFLRLCFCFALLVSSNFAQNSPSDTVPEPKVIPSSTPRPEASPSQTPTLTTGKREKQFFKNVLKDQRVIWTSPFRLQGKDAKWISLFGSMTTALIATDRLTSDLVEPAGALGSVSKHISWGGTIYAAGGIAAAFYFTGRATNNARARETGILSAQALLDSGIVVGVIKYITQRPKPNIAGGRGHFFQGDMSFLSFPSGHSASAWSIAAVISYEYKDRPKVRYGVLAAAMAVSIARFTGRTHFISEVLIGSAIGFYTGRYVYHTYHVPTKDPNSAPALPPKKTTKLMPMIIPLYDARTSTYGGRAVWTF